MEIFSRSLVRSKAPPSPLPGSFPRFTGEAKASVSVCSMFRIRSRLTS